MKGICRTIATVLIICSLLVGSLYLADPAVAYAASEGSDGLSEAIALDLYGLGDSEGGDSGPVMKAKPTNFAEALAQKCSLSPGSFGLAATSRFFIVGEKPSEDVLETVRLMDAQFAACGLPSDKPLEVVYGEPDELKAGDIVIRLSSDRGFLEEAGMKFTDQSYRLRLGKRAELETCTADGVYYGLIELLELAAEKQAAGKQDEDTGTIWIRGMEIIDGPDLEERAVFLDCGRKYFSVEWIQNFIRRSSLQRYNAIVLHFSEAEGLRLDSDAFPWLTSGIKSLSKEEMKQIVEFAHSYHMDVIPSFDVPGHNHYIVRKYERYVGKHPDFAFTYNGKTYSAEKTKGFGSIANHYSYNGETKASNYIGIDLTRKHSVAFMNVLIDEYAEFFRSLGCTDFDLCADEILGWDSFEFAGATLRYSNRWKFLEHWARYARKELGIRNGSASDTFINYINTVAARLESMGYTCRVFNDDIDINDDQHLELSPSIEVVYWYVNRYGANHFAKKGHTMHNGIETWTYYVVRKKGGKDIMTNKYKTVNARNIYMNWDPESFSRKKEVERYVDGDLCEGSYFFIWCDTPAYKSQNTIWNETRLRTWTNACIQWNSEVRTSASGIRSSMSFSNLKEFASYIKGYPGWAGDPSEEAELAEPDELTEAGSIWLEIAEEVVSPDVFFKGDN